MSTEAQCPRCSQSLGFPTRLRCPSCGAQLDVEVRAEEPLLKSPQQHPHQPSKPSFLVEEEQVANALVVDSEGYVCGRVLRARYGEDEVYLDVYKVVEQRSVIPDIEKLRQELLKTLPRKLLKPKSFRDLEDRVRRLLNLHPSAPVTERELIEYARRSGIPVPTKVLEHRDKKVVYSFSLKQVETIGVSSLGACVVLKEPVEAPASLSEKVPFRSTEQVKGKLAIDASGRILGRARKVMLGATLVLKVDLEDVVHRYVVDVEALEAMEGGRDLIERALMTLGVDRDQLTPDLLYEWARREGIRLPVRKERRVEKVGELDVRWDEIRKIGDVVLLSKRFEDYAPSLRPPLQPP